MTKPAKKMTAKQRVLKKYPSAKCVQWQGNQWFSVYRSPVGRGVSKPLSRWWITRREAWSDAAKRLSKRAKGK